MLNLIFWCFVLAPLFFIGFGIFNIQVVGDFLYWGAEPDKYLVHLLGQWAITFLIATLAVTPIRTLLRRNLVMYRRRLGLAAFFYAAAHLMTYFGFMLGFSISDLNDDLTKRPYIILGAVGWLLLLPLAITSTHRWQLRLKQNWRKLHRLIYPSSLLLVGHLWWQVKQDFELALVVTILIGLLLLARTDVSTIKRQLRKNKVADQKSSSSL